MITQLRHARLVLLLALLVITLFPSLALAQAAGPWLVPVGSAFAGNIATTSQAVVVEGQVDGDVTTWSGDITINGTVRGDVVSYTGHIQIGQGAQIVGSVLAVGGGVERHAQAQVARAELGAATENQALSSIVGVISPASASERTAEALPGRVLLGVFVALFLVAATLVWAAFWPNRSLAAGLMLQAYPVQAFLSGLLATCILVVLLPLLFGILAASLIGLPLLVVLVIAAGLPYLFGMAATVRALSLWAGARLAPETAQHPRAIAALIAAALFVAIICILSPPAAALLLLLFGAPGLGAVILSRGGLLAPVPASLR